MNVYLDEKVLIQKAASRVRGERLGKLFKLCDTQKTVSTRRLRKLLDELEKSDRQDGIHFKAIADFLKKLPNDTKGTR